MRVDQRSISGTGQTSLCDRSILVFFCPGIQHGLFGVGNAGTVFRRVIGIIQYVSTYGILQFQREIEVLILQVVVECTIEVRCTATNDLFVGIIDLVIMIQVFMFQVTGFLPYLAASTASFVPQVPNNL